MHTVILQQMQSPDIGLSAVEVSKTNCLQEAMMDKDVLDQKRILGARTLFEQVNAVICPMDCSGHGVCSNGE